MKKNIIIPQYTPYPKLTPALANLIFDKKVDQRAIIATIIDLALRKYIKITHYQGDFLGFSIKEEKTRSYSSSLISLKRTNKKAEDLFNYEKLILKELFKKDDKGVINLGIVNNLPKRKILDEIYKESVR